MIKGREIVNVKPRKYAIVFEDKTIARGVSPFYEDFKNLVPEGYVLDWAWNTKRLLVVNVIEGVTKDKVDNETPDSLVDLKEKAQERKNYYKMEM